MLHCTMLLACWVWMGLWDSPSQYGSGCIWSMACFVCVCVNLVYFSYLDFCGRVYLSHCRGGLPCEYECICVWWCNVFLCLSHRKLVFAMCFGFEVVHVPYCTWRHVGTTTSIQLTFWMGLIWTLIFMLEQLKWEQVFIWNSIFLYTGDPLAYYCFLWASATQSILPAFLYGPGGARKA